MQPQDKDRRRFTRIGFDAEAMITQAGAAYPVQLLDISVKGIMVRSDPGSDTDSLSEAEPAQLSLVLADGSQILMQVSLVHRGERDLGFRCESIDLESATHLRRLIELNLDTPDAAAQVLEELLSPAHHSGTEQDCDP